MKVFSLDISTHTGWALLENKKLLDYGLISVKIPDLGFKPDPTKSPHYPFNVLKGTFNMGIQIYALCKQFKPDIVVIENTVRGSGNRTNQRILEWIHQSVIMSLWGSNIKFVYMDPSEWRSILNIRMSKEDVKHNRSVSSGKIRGRIGKKHLVLRWINEQLKLNLKMKENNQADAIAIGMAYFTKIEG